MENVTWKRLILALTLVCVVVAEPVLAACNNAGCYGETLRRVSIAQDGKIWFVTETPENLDNLVPVDGCVLQNTWAGGAVPALYIPRDHPEYEHKYSMLLMAYTTGASIGFNMIKDPATGWCALGNLYVD